MWSLQYCLVDFYDITVHRAWKRATYNMISIVIPILIWIDIDSAECDAICGEDGRDVDEGALGTGRTSVGSRPLSEAERPLVVSCHHSIDV